jgi:hypothetical protein
MSEYEAVVGLNYRSSKTGEETRAEAGDKIVDMTEAAIRHELSAGNIRQVSPKKSVKKKGGENGDDTGVQSEARIEG